MEQLISFQEQILEGLGDFGVRLAIVLLLQGISVWSALIMMNETEDGKFPNKKILGIAMICSYMASFTGNYVSYTIDHAEYPYIELLCIPLILISLAFCCVLFTGGVLKILLSILISDLWVGSAQPIIVFFYCMIKGEKLRFMYRSRYDGDIVLEILLEVIIEVIMLFLFRPLFHQYRKLFLLEGKWCAVFIIVYLVIGNIWTVKPVRLTNQSIYPYYYNLIFIACFSSILILLLGYNQKSVINVKIQSLYLKQKMEQEYGLVFEDMDKNIRQFRHDIKKHMDVLSYLEESREINVSNIQLEKYRQDLKNIYTELTYGNYCSKYDMNIVLMQLEKECRNWNLEMCVSLKNLDLDSLPVYIRVQLMELVSDWVRAELERNGDMFAGQKVLLSFSGESLAGFHTLKIVLQRNWEKSSEDESHTDVHMLRGKRIWKKEVFIKKIKKLLCEYSPSVKTERSKNSLCLLICWHGRVQD